MDLTINGNYDAYSYVALLQLSILYLQRFDLNRLEDKDQKSLSAAIDDYFLTARIIAFGLSWASWLLSVYVGAAFGLADAALFLSAGLGTGILVTVLIPPLPYVDLFAHVVSWPAAVYLFHGTLVALGL